MNKYKEENNGNRDNFEDFLVVDSEKKAENTSLSSTRNSDFVLQTPIEFWEGVFNLTTHFVFYLFYALFFVLYILYNVAKTLFLFAFKPVFTLFLYYTVFRLITSTDRRIIPNNSVTTEINQELFDDLTKVYLSCNKSEESSKSVERFIIGILSDEKITAQENAANLDASRTTLPISSFTRNLFFVKPEDKRTPIIVSYSRDFRKLLLLRMLRYGKPIDLKEAIKSIQANFPPHEVFLTIDNDFLSELSLNRALSFPYVLKRKESLQKLWIILVWGPFTCTEISLLADSSCWNEHVVDTNAPGVAPQNQTFFFRPLSIEEKKLVAKDFTNCVIAEKKRIYSIVEMLIKKLSAVRLDLLI